MPKTPLRYPGGKSRGVEIIVPYIRNLDCGELCSPFLGGGSIELKCAEEGMTVHGYDLFQPLVWFWEALLSNPKKLADYVNDYRSDVRQYTDKDPSLEKILFRDIAKACKAKKCVTKGTSDTYCGVHANLLRVWQNDMLGVPKQVFTDMRELVNSRTQVRNQDKLFRAAAQYYIVNRTSFGGATTSGGWSWKASWARLTQNTLDNLCNFNVENFVVKRADFATSIAAHPDAALYLDPPYCLNKARDEEKKSANRETLYGTEGDHHEGFDHVGLFDILNSREKWVLSYNDCDYIRKLYNEYKIVKVQWAYGMNKSKESSEILILG